MKATPATSKQAITDESPKECARGLSRLLGTDRKHSRGNISSAGMSRLLRTTPRELKGQLIALALALWAVAIVNSATPTRFLRSGQIRGTDFVHFYTLGRLAASGQIAKFDDFDAIRRTQLAAVPEATDVYFAPVYGPQVSLALAPLGWLPYGWALAAWVLTVCRRLFLPVLDGD